MQSYNNEQTISRYEDKGAQRYRSDKNNRKTPTVIFFVVWVIFNKKLNFRHNFSKKIFYSHLKLFNVFVMYIHQIIIPHRE